MKNKLFTTKTFLQCRIRDLYILINVGRVFDPDAFLVDITFNHDIVTGDTVCVAHLIVFPPPTRRVSLNYVLRQETTVRIGINES